MNERAKKAFVIYLCSLAVAGGVIVYLATSSQGPGVSTDAAMMLATAQNVARGNGLIDYRGIELTQFPPLYSLILALGSLLFGIDSFTAGWALNIIAFAALIWLSGLCFWEAAPEEPMLAYFASFVIFSSTSLLTIFANIASDPLFTLMAVLALMGMTSFLKTAKTPTLVLTGVLIVLACFQRFAGLALVITGAMLLFYHGRKELKKALLRSGAFAILTGAPILLWGYLHNQPISGTAFGGRLPALPGPNFVAGLEKVLYWFIPLSIISRVGPVVLAAVIVGVLILAAWTLKLRGMADRARSPEVLAHIMFVLVYSAVLIFNISYYELKGINTDRVHIAMLPSLLVVMLAAAAPLLQAFNARLGPRTGHAAALLLFLAWTGFPVTRAYDYVRQSMQSGDVSAYNSINKGEIRSSALAQELMRLDVQDKKIYTNGSDSAWFILQTRIVPMPSIKSEDRMRYLKAHYTGWPGEGNDGYLIWFSYEAHKESYATPEELGAIAVLHELYSDGEGTIYAVSNR